MNQNENQQTGNQQGATPPAPPAPANGAAPPAPPAADPKVLEQLAELQAFKDQKLAEEEAARLAKLSEEQKLSEQRQQLERKQFELDLRAAGVPAEAAPYVQGKDAKAAAKVLRTWVDAEVAKALASKGTGGTGGPISPPSGGTPPPAPAPGDKKFDNSSSARWGKPAGK